MRYKLIVFFLCLGKITCSQGYGISTNAFFDAGIQGNFYSPFSYGFTISPYLSLEKNEFGIGIVIPVVYPTDHLEQKFSIGSNIYYKFYLNKSKVFKIYVGYKFQYIFISRKYQESSKYGPIEFNYDEHWFNNIFSIGHKIQLANKFGINTNFGYSFPIIFVHSKTSGKWSRADWFSDPLKSYFHFDIGLYVEF